MQTDVAGTSETSFEVTFQDFVTSRVNLYLRGKGSLVVRGSGAAFVFSGKKRDMIGLGSRTIELEFKPEHIRNVFVEGRCVQFVRNLGGMTAEDKPFIFFCRNPADAATVASLLPATKDDDFVASRDFVGKLKQVRDEASPWTSITNLIIAANVIVFVVLGLLGAGWIQVGDMMPYIRFGANRADVTTDGEWWRLLASMFLHFGLLHLVLNMWALFQAGHFAEKLFGRVPFAVAYFGSGLAGSFASLLWRRDQLIWSAGASGAIFGIYGGLLGYLLRQRQALPKAVFRTLFKSAAAFVGFNLVFGFVYPGIDNAAHLGGFFGGVLLGWLLALPIEADARKNLVRPRLSHGLVAIAIICVSGAVFAPRYNYRLADERAWYEVIKPRLAEEPELMRHQQATLTTYARDKDVGKVSGWLTERAIPFYTSWRDEALALNLAPGRRTEQQRDAFANILRMKVEAYKQLLASLAAGEASALRQYADEEEKIRGELKKLAPP